MEQETDLLPEEILAIIKKSGYLFEQQVASIFENKGYHTVTNWAFKDLEQDKSREMDVTAYKLMYGDTDRKTSPSGGCHFICECKNSATPFVFIKRPKNVLDTRYIPEGIKLTPDVVTLEDSLGNKYAAHAFFNLGLSKSHHATRIAEKYVQVCKIIRNGKKVEAQNSGIIDSFIFPLAKAQREKEKQAYSGNGHARFIFNLVVVNSTLFELDSSNEFALPTEVPYVPFLRDIHSNTLKGKFLITFVNFKHLNNFIETEVESFCRLVGEQYKSLPHLFTLK